MAHFHFWAKTGTGDDDRLIFKPVAHHLADVAACALRFLTHSPARLRRESTLTGLPPEDHARLCALLAGLHDLGKISRGFQIQCPILWPEAELGPCPNAATRTRSHWEATALLLNASDVRVALAPVFGRDGLPDQMIAAIAGHHGKPPRAQDCAGEPWRAARDAEIGPACVQAAAELCVDFAALFAGLQVDTTTVATPAFSFLLNGLTTLADWVGSDTGYFGFEAPDMALADYWPLALSRADAALHAKGLIPANPGRDVSLQALSPGRGAARPMQSLALSLDIPPEPQIVLIEDGTGSGKTEAALLLAQRMMAQGLGEGLFIALPTMATANAMHHRLAPAMPALFDGVASLVLAHGKAGIAAALERLQSHRDDSREPDSVASWCNAWIGDSRKKAFFADAGAGTIDQTFLSVLRKKHLTLRQYALAGRILIIDEAHACDAYMGEELRKLVEVHAAFGGSLIILSATLGLAMKQQLIKAFASGRGLNGAACNAIAGGVASPAYPLLSRWSEAGGLQTLAVEGDPGLARAVDIARLSARSEVVQRALRAAQQGAAVAVICNAVDSAIATWECLIAAGQPADRCHLFHARFVVDDRLAIEEQVQALFGRDSTAAQRQGRIIVATQVIEQSLDVDFDVMFSDLAPVDLLIQRAGRLWRHARTQRPVETPVLRVLSPDPRTDVSATWLDESLGPAAHVYKLPGVLWRSARDLFAKGRLDTPGDLRRLIESAFDPSTDDLPPALAKGHDDSFGTFFGDKTIARHNTIKLDDGYLGLSDLSTDEDIGTRLGQETIAIRLARRTGEKLVPLNQRSGATDTLNWALSEIQVSGPWLHRVAGEADPADPEAVDKTRVTWPEWERNIRLLEVDPDGPVLTRGGPHLTYGPAGLRTVKD